jgi:hypothetical protein
MKDTDPKLQYFVDCGLQYEPTQKTITDITTSNPVLITCAGHGFLDGEIVLITDVVGMTEVNDNYYKVANKTTDSFQLTDPDDDTTIDGTAFTEYTSGGYAQITALQFSGLSHLDGADVAVLADGKVVDDCVISDGKLTLTEPAAFVNVGLPYESDLETLNVEIGLSDGTSQGRLLKISQVTLRVQNFRGGWLGPDADHLTEIPVSDYFPADPDSTALFSGDIKQTLDSDYGDGGRIFYRQSDPLPVSILAILPLVSVGG